MMHQRLHHHSPPPTKQTNRSPTDDETRMFYEIVVAPGYTPEGLEVLKGKSKALRILEAKPRAPSGRSLRQVAGGWLMQVNTASWGAPHGVQGSLVWCLCVCVCFQYHCPCCWTSGLESGSQDRLEGRLSIGTIGVDFLFVFGICGLHFAVCSGLALSSSFACVSLCTYNNRVLMT